MEQFWDSLQKLILATNQTDLTTSLNIALSAGERLSGSDILAVYLANDEDPGFCLYGSIGAAELLPDQLPAQDLIQLRKPQQWTPGQRSNTSLHQAARNGHLSYLTSAPMGQSNAIIGLVVIADTQASPSAYILNIVMLMANAITIIIERHFQLRKLRSNLDNSNHQLQIYSILEEQIHEGVLLADKELNILHMNYSAERMLGYSKEEVHGQKVDTILIGTESLLPALKETQAGSANYNLGDVNLYRRNGERFRAQIRTIPVSENNTLQAIIILFNDLSELDKILEDSKQLEQLAYLGRVTTNFAHEVGNPINSISTGLQWLAHTLPSNDPNQVFIGRLQENCDRLEELMKSVLSFSRTTKYDMEINLPFIIKRIVDRLTPKIEALNIESSLQIEPECPTILGNASALEQVFTNLMNNAVQVMRETGGKIALKIQKVETADGEFFVETSVADTGPGIAPEEQEKIFEPYYTTKRSGTGLGLPITKEIIQAHQGSITLDSFPGGSVFRVRLPVYKK